MLQTTDFAGLRVAAFESRRAADMARLIEKFGGVASVSPSMREVPLGNNAEAIEFARQVISGEIDVVVLTTGVGFRHLLAEIDAAETTGDKTTDASTEGSVNRETFLQALGDRITVVRGPKPVVALAEVGLKPTHRAGEPNTWREVLTSIDTHVPLAGKTIGIQEYGKPNVELASALEDRGATVHCVQIYRWDFPEDTGPLADNLRAIAEGQRDVALFTSAHQAVNLLRMAEQLDLAESVPDQFRRLVVGSIGPTTSEMLRELGLPVDLEPEHSKMGRLVAAASEQAGPLLQAKRR